MLLAVAFNVTLKLTMIGFFLWLCDLCILTCSYSLQTWGSQISFGSGQANSEWCKEEQVCSGYIFPCLQSLTKLSSKNPHKWPSHIFLRNCGLRNTWPVSCNLLFSWPVSCSFVWIFLANLTLSKSSRREFSLHNRRFFLAEREARDIEIEARDSLPLASRSALG